MNKIVVILGVVILIGIGGVLLLGNSQSNNQPVTQEPIQNTVTQEPIQNTVTQEPIQNTEIPIESVTDNSESTDSMEKSNVKEFTIVSRGLSFAPEEIKVNVGDTVRLTYINTGGTHDLGVDEFNVRTQLIGGGDTEVIEFVADQAGTFEFYCSVPGHRAAGMKGTLVVE